VAVPERGALLEPLPRLDSGTLVLWEQLDRAVDKSSPNSEGAHERFRLLIEDVQSHLAMIFHRYLEGSISSRRGALKIFINGTEEDRAVQPWNPFAIPGAPSSKETPSEVMKLADNRVEVRGYVLPHKDRITQQQLQAGAGPQGWVAQQGFYIYRNDRVIVPGDWLRLGRARPWAKEEQYRLARISIDISNMMDEDWGLDIKKSTARPPASIRERLTDLAESVRGDARQVFAHRGQYGSQPPSAVIERPWNAKVRDGRNVYVINREHPLIAQALKRLGTLADHLKPVLRLIEETVPVERIWLDSAESPASNAMPYEGQDESTVLTDIRLARDFLAASLTNKDALRTYLEATEPFKRFPNLIDRAIKEM
jgi:hypothetical protein